MQVCKKTKKYIYKYVREKCRSGSGQVVPLRGGGDSGRPKLMPPVLSTGSPQLSWQDCVDRTASTERCRQNHVDRTMSLRNRSKLRIKMKLVREKCRFVLDQISPLRGVWRFGLARGWLKSTSTGEKYASQVNSNRILQISILSTMQFIVSQKGPTLRNGSKLWSKMKSVRVEGRFGPDQISPLRDGVMTF